MTMFSLKRQYVFIVFCKLFDQDAHFTLKPIKDVNSVKIIHVMRDSVGIIDPNIKYHVSFVKFPKWGKYLLRVISSLRLPLGKNKVCKIAYGIYEYPHGLMAYLNSLFSGSPFIISIISNPAYEKIRKGFRKYLMFFLIKKSSIVTVTGSSAKDYLISMKVPADKIFILPNSIDTEKFQPILIEKKYDIISIGRLSPEKNVSVLLKIVSYLKKKYPKIKVAIAGAGPDKVKIEQEIIRKNLISNVVLLGYIKDDDLLQFFNSGKIFVLNSETEGFPRTIVQAGSCGLPIIASNVGDISDLIRNNINSYLIDNYDDIITYTARIESLLSNSELYNKFSTEIRNSVIEKFSYSAASKVWYNILKRIDKCE